MILILINFISRIGIKIPHALYYSSTRMVLAATTTLVITIMFGKYFIKKLYELKIGHTVRVSDIPILSANYQKSGDVPSMGGILFLASILISAILWLDLKHSFSFILILTTLSMGILGGVDDYLKIKKNNSVGITSRKKLFFQVCLSSLLGLYLFCPYVSEFFYEKVDVIPPYAKMKVISEMKIKTFTTSEYSSIYFIPFLKKPLILSGLSIIIAFFITILVVSGSINAVNLTDGLDGLASGLVLLVAFVLAVFAFVSNNIIISQYLNILYIEGSSEIAIYLCATMGACLGFLWFNGYPAQVFMGDIGSLALGGIIGVSAVLLRREILLALVGGVFVAETMSVILQVISFKLRGGKRIFNCAPLHHHFEISGWHEVKVVIRFWMIGLILALIGLASLKIQ